MHIWWPIKLISDQLWDLVWDHLNNRFPSPISDWSSIKSPIKLMAKYWRIKSDTWRLNVTICSSLLTVFAPETSPHIAGQNDNSRIKIKFQAWRSITTNQFILCMVFCEKIKWIDAPVLICDRKCFWQQTMDDIVDIVAMTTFTGWVSVLAQRMLGNLAHNTANWSHCHCQPIRLAYSRLSWRPINLSPIT